MKLLGTDVPPMGMGCWPIGGPFYQGSRPLGYANADDAESLRTIHAALDAGIRLFDTAAVYGTGNAERLLGQALADRPDALIVTKIGMEMDETARQMGAEQTDPAKVGPAIDGCLRRLGRDRIDLLLLHLNTLPVDTAAGIFDAMETAQSQGKIRAFGWSTDLPDSVRQMSNRAGFVAVQHAMNVFLDVPSIQAVVAETDLVALIRSPLAMGVLTGKYDAASVMASDDIRSTNEAWRGYFLDGRVNPDYMTRLDAVRDLLQTGGRSIAQGALCWLLAKSNRNLPIPGARTVGQVVDNAGALAHGPLPQAVMDEIESVIRRPPEGPPGAR